LILNKLLLVNANRKGKIGNINPELEKILFDKNLLDLKNGIKVENIGSVTNSILNED